MTDFINNVVAFKVRSSLPLCNGGVRLLIVNPHDIEDERFIDFPADLVEAALNLKVVNVDVK